MDQRIARMCVQSATEKGWTARQSGQAREECPYLTDGMRAAWRSGWDRADRMVF